MKNMSGRAFNSKVIGNSYAQFARRVPSVVTWDCLARAQTLFRIFGPRLRLADLRQVYTTFLTGTLSNR